MNPFSGPFKGGPFPQGSPTPTRRALGKYILNSSIICH